MVLRLDRRISREKHNFHYAWEVPWPVAHTLCGHVGSTEYANGDGMLVCISRPYSQPRSQGREHLSLCSARPAGDTHAGMQGCLPAWHEAASSSATLRPFIGSVQAGDSSPEVAAERPAQAMPNERNLKTPTGTEQDSIGFKKFIGIVDHLIHLCDRASVFESGAGTVLRWRA